MSKENFKKYGERKDFHNEGFTTVVNTEHFCYDNLALKKLVDSLFRPPTHISSDYKNWIAVWDLKTCIECKNLHGKIYHIEEILGIEPPLHESCRCKIEAMPAAFVGTATIDGANGTDVYLSENGRLPSNYITKKQAKKSGWISNLGNLSVVEPGKSIGGDVYRNRNGHLPNLPGRIWYEADINYTSGYRNDYRIIYSNDGLMFATYDHYVTFVQIH